MAHGGYLFEQLSRERQNRQVPLVLPIMPCQTRTCDLGFTPDHTKCSAVEFQSKNDSFSSTVHKGPGR